MSSPERTLSASWHYRTFGNLRPPISDLQKIIAKAKDSKSTLSDMLTGAHASVDFAVHRAGSNRYFDQAQQFLDDTRARAVKRSGDLNTKTSTWVDAVLFESQIDGWKAAARGKDVVTDYEALLATSMEALRITQIRQPQYRIKSEAKMVEFLPLVLGARSQRRYGTGWIGRLALLREDGSMSPSQEDLKAYNPNWDVGICLPGTETSFLQPLPIQIKRSNARVKQLAASTAAGVRIVSAVSCGFSDPEQIILSCVNEIETVATPEDVALLHSEQLDFVTSLLETKLRAPLEGPEQI